MGDELRLDVSRHKVDPAQDLTRLQAPDCAGGVNAGRPCGHRDQDRGVILTARAVEYDAGGHHTHPLPSCLTQEVGVHLVPVKGGERGAEVRVLVVVQKTFQTRLCITDLSSEIEDETEGDQLCEQYQFSSTQ